METKEIRDVPKITEYGNVYEIRAFPGGNDKYNSFIQNKIVAIGWKDLGDVSKLSRTKLKEEISTSYRDKEKKPIYNNSYAGQIAGYFVSLTHIKKNDLIFIPYIKGGVPIITVCRVTAPYKYNNTEPYYHEDITQQISIEIVKDVNRNVLKEEYTDLNNSLNARLTLTKLDKNRHKEGIDFCLFSDQADIDEDTVLTAEKSKESYKKRAADMDKNYIDNLNELRTLIKESNDEIVIKSLTMTAFSEYEHFIKERLKNKLYSYIHPNGDNLAEIIDVFVVNDLFRPEKRQTLGNLTFQKVSFDSGYSSLRNCLAHGSQKVKIDTDKKIITYTPYGKTKKGESKQPDNVMITALFEKFFEIVDDIESDEELQNG